MSNDEVRMAKEKQKSKPDPNGASWQPSLLSTSSFDFPSSFDFRCSRFSLHQCVLLEIGMFAAAGLMSLSRNTSTRGFLACDSSLTPSDIGS